MPKAKPKTPKYLPKNNPARIKRDETIITERAKGKAMSAIAKQTDLSKAQVCKILSDDDAKAKLQLIINKHIDSSDKIQDNLISIASTTPGDSKHIRTADILTATKEHNQIIGIASSHTQQNVFIGKYYQQNNHVAVGAEVIGLLQKHLGDTVNIEVPEP